MFCFSFSVFSGSPSPFPFSPCSAIEASQNYSTAVKDEEHEPDDLSLQIGENQSLANPNLDEAKVLKQLSDILPIRHSTSIPHLYSPDSPLIQSRPEIRVSADGFLLLEDKLRGVFLQKLKGKAAIHNALCTALGDVELSFDVFSAVLNRGNLGGEAMVMFFNWAVEQLCVGRYLGMYHVILKALGRRKFFGFMMEKFHEISVEGISPTSETLMIVLDSFIRTHRISRAIEMFEKLEEFGMKCDTVTFNVLLMCLCKRFHVGTANSLLNSMKGKVEFDCVSYNVVISGWSKLGRVIEMEKCLKAMVEDGFGPDSETYCYLIEGLGRAGQVDDAVKVFKSMKTEDVGADTGVYNAMISNYVSMNDFDESKKYYEEMLRNNYSPNLETYRKLISGLLKARKVADALEMFEEMLHQRVIPTTGVITSFIEPLCNYGPPHAAMMIYNSARKAGCNISPTAYKLLLMRLSRFGKCGMLLKLWNEMQDCGYSSGMEVYEYVISGLCNNGQLDTAVYVMEEALGKGFCPSRLMCSKLNNKLVAFNKTESAYKLFLKIKEARVNENARRYCRYNGWHV